MGSFHSLFSIEIKHVFFTGEACLNLDFIPSLRSQKRLDRIGLLTRGTENGIHVFYDSGQSDVLQYEVDDPDEPFSFQYRVFSRDPFFKNYTDVSSHKTDALFYFDGGNAREEAGFYRLHEAEYVSEVDFQSLDAPMFSEVLTKKDRLVKPVCVLDIPVSQGEFKGKPKHYTVKFDSRKTFWKYYVLGDFVDKKPYIADLNHETEFEFGGTESLPGNRTALVFRSRSSIPLREKLDVRFQLKAQNGGNGKVMIKRLPVASASQIATETINGKESVISEIYVNC